MAALCCDAVVDVATTYSANLSTPIAAKLVTKSTLTGK